MKPATGDRPITLRPKGIHTYYVSIGGQTWVADRTELQLLANELNQILKDDR